jgi:hypothetical protein
MFDLNYFNKLNLKCLHLIFLVELKTPDENSLSYFIFMRVAL